MSSKVLIIIPAYNEEASLARTVGYVQKNALQYDFLVIDDGSSDATSRICRENGYPYASFLANLGLAGAFRAGMKYAYRHGYEYAIQFDADGQHDARYVSKLVEHARATGADVVIGSRFVDQKKPKTLRMFGSNLLSALIKLTSGKRILDPTSGMRLYNSRVIELFATGFDFSPEPDTLGLLARNGYAIEEVQVEMHERTAGKSYLTLTKSYRYMRRMRLSLMYVQWFRRCK